MKEGNWLFFFILVCKDQDIDCFNVDAANEMIV